MACARLCRSRAPLTNPTFAPKGCAGEGEQIKLHATRCAHYTFVRVRVCVYASFGGANVGRLGEGLGGLVLACFTFSLAISKAKVTLNSEA